MTTHINITITTNEDDDPDVSDTLDLIGDQIANGFKSGFDRNEDERYEYSVVDAETEAPAVTRTLTKAQADVIKHYQGYNVPAQWFVGQTFDNGYTEVIALGARDADDLDNPSQFVWSFRISADGTDVSTSEGEIPEGFSTGIEI